MSTDTPPSEVKVTSESVKGLQLHDKDTGSADVQIALLTERIAHLTDHLKSHV